MADSQGSKWRKSDLHVHTPASYDWKGGTVSPDELITEAVKKGLDLIAITDHHSIKWIDLMKEAGRKQHLPVLSGIEIRTDKGNKGIHVIGIFPESVSSKEIYDKVLCPIGLSESDITKKGNELCYCNFENACQLIHSLGGMVFLHAGQKANGIEQLDSDVNALLKLDIASKVDCLEVTSIKQVQNYRSIVFPNVKREWPIIITSDSTDRAKTQTTAGHTKELIGTKFTWIKADPTFNGLKQIIYFPEERVSYEEQKPTYLYPRITKIILDNHKDGHCLSTLKDAVHLSDNLTSIIGHPSIGKSTFADTIAYAFGLDELVGSSTKVENIQKINKELCIRVEYSQGNVTNFMVRDFAGNYSGNMSPSEAKITYLNQGYIDNTARDQKQVSVLINDMVDTSTLDLVWVDIEKKKEELKTQRIRYLSKYKLEEQLKSVMGEIAELNKFFDLSKSDEYKALDKNRRELRTQKSDVVNLQRKLNEAKIYLTKAQSHLKLYSIDQNKFKELFPSIGEIILPDPINTIKQLIEKIEEVQLKIKKAPEIGKLEKDELDMVPQMQKLLGAEGVSGFSDKLIQEKESALQTKLEQKRKVQEEISECELAKISFDNTLKEILLLKESWDNSNKKMILDFNKDLDDTEITYEEKDLKSWLISVLTDEIKQAWQEFSPDLETKRLIRPSVQDIENLITTIKKENNLEDESLPAFLIKSLEENLIPYGETLEFVQWIFGDRSPVIKEFLLMRLKEFYEKGEHQINYKGKNISKDGLSFTERCGALLEVVLQKGDTPLILDQPEENLGSSYITSVFIKKLLARKNHRQIIIISHNANTVVLADSELVICFDRIKGGDNISFASGAIEAEGMKDFICEIIEGGALAFEMRAKRYHD